MSGHLKFYLNSWDAFAETYRARKYGRWEIPRTCRGRDRLRATNLNVGKSHCSHTLGTKQPSTESWLAMVSTGVRNFGRRDVMRIKRSPVTPLTLGFERVSERQQPGSPGPGCTANIYFATGENDERCEEKHRVNYKVNGREIRLSCLLLSRSDVTGSCHRNQTRVHELKIFL